MSAEWLKDAIEKSLKPKKYEPLGVIVNSLDYGKLNGDAINADFEVRKAKIKLEVFPVVPTKPETKF